MGRWKSPMGFFEKQIMKIFGEKIRYSRREKHAHASSLTVSTFLLAFLLSAASHSFHIVLLYLRQNSAVEQCNGFDFPA